MKLLTKQNLIFFCVIAVIFAASLVAWYLIKNTRIDNPVAEIYKDGVLIETVADLHIHVRPTFTIGTPETGINVVRVKNGVIWVSEADCPTQICVNTGFISNGIMPIICVPNRLEIRIVGGDNGDVDAVAR